MTSTKPIVQSGYPFNTALESGLRALVLLAAMSPAGCDLQRLLHYDYLLVHAEDAGDASNAPNSLHPPTPYRSGEVLVRRNLVERGCRLMMSKALLLIEYTEGGIQYRASDDAEAFLSYLETPYAERIREAAGFVVKHFASMDDESLTRFMTSNLGRWGAEFVRESLVNGASRR